MKYKMMNVAGGAGGDNKPGDGYIPKLPSVVSSFTTFAQSGK